LWKPTISRSLQITAVVVLALIIGASMQQLLRMHTSVVNDAAQQMARLDMAFAEQTGRAVETVDLTLRGIVDGVQPGGRLYGAERGTVDDLLRRRIEGVRQILEVAVIDAAGKAVYSSALGNSVIDASRPEHETARAALAQHAADPDDGLLISNPIAIPGAHWVTLLTRRIPGNGGGFGGIAVAVLNLDYFEEFYRAVDLPEDGAIVLLRADGVVLARYPHRDDLIGTSAADQPPFREVLTHETAGTLQMESPIDGTRRVLAIRALKAFPLAVDVSVAEDRVLMPWRKQAGAFLVAVFAVCLVMGTLLLLLARESRRTERLLAETRDAKDAAEDANAELRVQMDERARAEASLRQAQRIEAVGQLTGGVAHDFNNLLTVLLGNIDLLQQTGNLGPAELARLQRMRGAAERGAKLTDQLLSFARRQPLLPQAMRLNDVVAGMTDLLSSAAGGNIRIETRFEAKPWTASVDPTQFELVVLNLVINARDAMPQGGTVTVETANVTLGPPTREDDPPAGDYVMVRVVDTGHGMPPEVLARVFEPFFTTKGPGFGSGLGLSQVFGLARQSGGGVQIDSAPGKGTAVRVYLPRASAEAVAAEAAPSAADAGAGGSARVLLVDDDEAVRSTTGMILETMGYEVIACDSGPDALARLDEQVPVDILLTDVAMPGMNGPDLARRVRALRPFLPIVFFSGYADPDSVAGDAIRQRIVRKPFRASELAAHIEAALAEGRAAA
jgi:signal transduction histidine kinase/CheY-like chemotaxis protein